MKRAIGYILVITILLSSLMMTACGSETITPTSTTSITQTTTTPKTTTATTTPTATAMQPESGGILKIICGGTSKPLGWTPDIVANEIYSLPMQEALWFRDGKGTLQPWLATSWETTADWSSITFHLRKGVKFLDGTDFNASAAKWMMEEYRKVNFTGTNVWGDISIIDDYTIKLNITKYINTLEQFLGQVKFVSPTAYEKNGLDWMKENPVGTGPFKLKEFKLDVSIELERNPEYWGSQPYIDGIKYLFISDSNTKKSAFLAGDAQVLYLAITDPQTVSELMAMDKGYSYDITPLAHVYIYFDHGNTDLSLNTESPFSNLQVRQAVEYAIDRDKIAATIGKGFWRPIQQWAAPEMYGYNPDITPREYNPEKAKELLASAGYPNGFSTVFNVSQSTDPTYSNAIQGYLEAVGIQAEVKIASRAQLSQQRTEGWTGLMDGNAGIWGGEVLERMQFHYGGVQNISVYRSPEYLSMLADGLAQTDHAKKDQIAQQIVKYMWETEMMVPVYGQGPTIVTSDGVHGLEFLKARTLDWWTFSTTWLEQKAR